MGKIKVVLDTNVIVSAFGWHGNPEEVVRLAINGFIINFTSIDMLDELRIVLSYPKMGFSKTLQAEIIETIFLYSSTVKTIESLKVVANDYEDNKVIECAVSAGADCIISGDKHLLDLKRFRNTDIITAGEFLKRWGAR